MRDNKTTAITDNACIGGNSDELLKKYATSNMMRNGKDAARISAFAEAEMMRKGNANLDSYAKPNLMRSPRNKT
jgi:hypothetical protein